LFPAQPCGVSFSTVKGVAVWPRLMKASLTVQAGARTARLLAVGGGNAPLPCPQNSAQSILADMVCFLACNVAQCAVAYKPFHSVPSRWRHLHSHLSTLTPPAHTREGWQPRVYSRGTAGNQAGRCVLSTNWSPARAHAVKPGKWRGVGWGGLDAPPSPFSLHRTHCWAALLTASF